MATHGSVCAIHAKHPSLRPRRETAHFLKLGIDYDFRPGSYIGDGDDDVGEWVTLVCIALNNVLSDCVYVEARQDEFIELRVRDDHDQDYKWQPAEIDQPFTLRELISFLDSVNGPAGEGLVRGLLEYNYQPDRDNPAVLENFVEVTSTIYPELERYFRAEVLLWVETKIEGRIGSA